MPARLITIITSAKSYSPITNPIAVCLAKIQASQIRRVLFNQMKTDPAPVLHVSQLCIKVAATGLLNFYDWELGLVERTIGAFKTKPQRSYVTELVRKISGLAPALCRYSAGLKCRCDYFQVFSRRLAFAGSGQNSLDEPSSTRRAACVKRCGFISLNTLQGRSQGVLVLTGCLHCQAANPDNRCCYQHCCDDTYSGPNFDGFHKTALSGA